MPVRYDLSHDRGWEVLRETVGQIRLAGKRPIVEIVREEKSDRQRGYQWGWFYAQAVKALSEAGYSIVLADGSQYPWDPELLHECLKKNVLRPLYRQWGFRESLTTAKGQIIPLPVSTEKFKGKKIKMPEFAEYIRECRRFLWEWREIAVPEPEDSYYQEFESEMAKASRVWEAA